MRHQVLMTLVMDLAQETLLLEFQLKQLLKEKDILKIEDRLLTVTLIWSQIECYLLFIQR